MMGTEVHEACSMGDVDALEEYINSGKYDVNMKDPEWQDRTPLHWACAKGTDIQTRLFSCLYNNTDTKSKRSKYTLSTF